MVSSERGDFESEQQILPLNALDISLLGISAIVRLLHFSYIPDFDRTSLALRKVFENYDTFSSRVTRGASGCFALERLSTSPALERGRLVVWSPDSFSASDASLFLKELGSPVGRPSVVASLSPVRSGSVLAISISHVVADGFSTFSFISAWSSEVRGQRYRVPALRQWLSGWDSIELAQKECGRSPVDSKNRAARDHPEPRFYAVQRMSDARVRGLCRQLSDSQFEPTRHEALTALLVHQYGSDVMGGGKVVRLRMPIDLRGRHPAIEPFYMGNAFRDAIVDVSLDSCSTKCIAQTARRIRLAIVATIDGLQSRVRGTPHIWSTSSGVDFSLRDYPEFNEATDIVCTNMARLPIHTLDFGGGPPVRVLVPQAPTGISLLPARDGIEAHILGRRPIQPEAWSGCLN